LFATLGSDGCSEDSVQYWVARFQSGDTSCEDISGPGRPLADLAEAFRLFLLNYPFASAHMLSGCSSVRATTAKEFLVPDLDLKKFTRRWVLHTLSDPHKLTRAEALNELLQILNDLEADSFDGITTGDTSWFHCLYDSSAKFAKSPGNVIPRMRKGIGVKKTYLPFSLPIGSC
jgi:hypothetical protein